MKTREHEISANTPLIFFEFSEGTEDERLELIVRLYNLFFKHSINWMTGKFKTHKNI